MSAIVNPAGAPSRPQAPARASMREEAAERYWVRVATFAALAAYATERWATLMRPSPTWRLAGLVALSVLLAAAAPRLRRFGDPVGGLVALGIVLLAFPVAGLNWHWFVHERITVSANEIGNGLQALPNVLLPY
ncbi:MAG: hypothetical protein WAK93_12680, partial [Solirubrobacteraceae bacterium]